MKQNCKLSTRKVLNITGQRWRKNPTFFDRFRKILNLNRLHWQMSPTFFHHIVTKVLIILNIGVFLAMCIAGAHPIEPSAETVFNWGGIHPDYIADGQWWRFLSSMFIHIGIFHLAMNLYFLYIFGRFLEPVLGKAYFLIGYFSTGILAGLISYSSHKGSNIVEAGASGALAGIFGIYLFIIFSPLIHSKEERNQHLSFALQVIAMNIIYAAKAGESISHAAHLGGIFCGLIIGGIFYLSLRCNSSTSQYRKWIISGGIAIALPVIMVPTLTMNKKHSDSDELSNTIREYHQRFKNRYSS